MKTIMTLIVALLFGQTVFAGDAGWYSETCHTDSKRTVLTIMEDYSGFDNYTVYTLIVDGLPLVMDSRKPEVKIGNSDVDSAQVFVNGELMFEKKDRLITIYKDPREGTIAAYDATPTPWSTVLTCKTYWPEP